LLDGSRDCVNRARDRGKGSGDSLGHGRIFAMNRAQNPDRGFGVNPECARIPLLGRFRRSHGFSGAGFSLRGLVLARPQTRRLKPAPLNSPSIALLILIPAPMVESQKLSWDTIFARTG
jgi:hypothetical protein